MKFLSRTLLSGLAALMLLPSVPVYASDSNQTVADNSSTDVILNGPDSRFSVTVPKNIMGTGSEGILSYTVTCEGDIASDERVTVVPDYEVVLSQKYKSDVTASIVQDRLQWNCDEFDIVGNGYIEYEGLTAGAYTGSFNFNIELSNLPVLTLSVDDVQLGAGNTAQVNAYIDGEVSNDIVTWSSDNDNIIVSDGLVETSANAKVGDTATVTVSASNIINPYMASVMALDDESDVIIPDTTVCASFTVTVIDMVYTAEGEIIDVLNILPGESKTVEVTIIPVSVSGTVSWSTTAPAGVSILKNGNTVTVKVASDMEMGKSYDLVATYGDYSKLLKINVHAHTYTEQVVNPTCLNDGYTRHICECGDYYDVAIPATGHNYVNGTCTNCGDRLSYTLSIKAGSNVNSISGGTGSYHYGDQVPVTVSYGGKYPSTVTFTYIMPAENTELVLDMVYDNASTFDNGGRGYATSTQSYTVTADAGYVVRCIPKASTGSENVQPASYIKMGGTTVATYWDCFDYDPAYYRALSNGDAIVCSYTGHSGSYRIAGNFYMTVLKLNKVQ